MYTVHFGLVEQAEKKVQLYANAFAFIKFNTHQMSDEIEVLISNQERLVAQIKQLYVSFKKSNQEIRHKNAVKVNAELYLLVKEFRKNDNLLNNENVSGELDTKNYFIENFYEKTEDIIEEFEKVLKTYLETIIESTQATRGSRIWDQQAKISSSLENNNSL